MYAYLIFLTSAIKVQNTNPINFQPWQAAIFLPIYIYIFSMHNVCCIIYVKTLIHFENKYSLVIKVPTAINMSMNYVILPPL